jgi:two-component system, NarL family, sensor histidine kinase DegS
VNNRGLDEISRIMTKIIGDIVSSRGQIFQIVDDLRSEYEDLKVQLEQTKRRISKVTYIAKQNEEKALKEKRYKLESAFKEVAENIQAGEKAIYHISIALGFLEGDTLPVLEGENQNSEMFLGVKILEAQEDERKRVARDIHDGPAQHMANVVMKVDICKMIIQKDLAEGLKELEDLKESVRVALKEVRNIIFDLRPMSLDDLGLNQTIQEMVKAITKESPIDIELMLKPIKNEIEPIIQVAVYRIIQEIFNNIKKHSKAKNAEVKLDFGTKYLMLIVSDDGVGFNVEETLKKVKTKGTSYGLISLLDRVNQLQGEIDIKSSIGAGTVYNIKLPISREVIKDEQWAN